MTDEFDELEKQIMAAMRKVYTETAIDHAMNPKNSGEILNPDGFGSATSSCGEAMEIRLKAKDGRITDATFWTNGCSTTVACGSMATEIIKGEDVEQALAIKQSDILKALGDLPGGNHNCALLAANAVKAAVKDYIAIRKEPWKKPTGNAET
jgi:nitrogen fixation NifU-like protein